MSVRRWSHKDAVIRQDAIAAVVLQTGLAASVGAFALAALDAVPASARLALIAGGLVAAMSGVLALAALHISPQVAASPGQLAKTVCKKERRVRVALVVLAVDVELTAGLAMGLVVL